MLTLLISGLYLTTVAQKTGNGQNEVQQRGRKNHGGPSHSNLRLATSPETVNLTDFEIQIDPTANGGYTVTAKGLRSQGVKGCDNCNVSNKIVFTGNAGSQFKSASKELSAKQQQLKNPAANITVTYKSADSKTYSAVTDPNVNCSISTLPAGVYSIWVGGKEVILNYILSSSGDVKATPKSGN